METMKLQKRVPVSAMLDPRIVFPAIGSSFVKLDPRLMVKLLIYGYANGITSSRKLERATYRDVAVRMLCADQHPDYRSIARFRKRHWRRWASCSCRR